MRPPKLQAYVDHHAIFDVLEFTCGWMVMLPVNPHACSFCGR